MLKLWCLSYWNRPTILNVIANFLLIGATVIMGLTVSVWIQRHSLFNIKALVVTGMRGSIDLSHQDIKLIKTQIMPKINGNFFTTDLYAIQKQFQELPWIRHVLIRRVWPNRLWVNIEQHQPIAIFNDTFLINSHSEVFLNISNNTNKWQHLPQFYGDESNIETMQTYFNQFNQWLSVNHITVRKLYLSERKAWTAVLSNNLVLEIGREDLQPTIEKRIYRWLNTWTNTQKMVNVKPNTRIDLRYANGYAVKK